MKTIILIALILVGTVITPAQNVDLVDISFKAVSQVCGAPSDVQAHVVVNGSVGILNVDLILVDENGNPEGLVESRRVNTFGYANFLQVQPCSSYRVRPRVTKGESLTFDPAYITIQVQSGDPFFLEFVGTPLDN